MIIPMHGKKGRSIMHMVGVSMTSTEGAAFLVGMFVLRALGRGGVHRRRGH